MILVASSASFFIRVTDIIVEVRLEEHFVVFLKNALQASNVGQSSGQGIAYAGACSSDAYYTHNKFLLI